MVWRSSSAIVSGLKERRHATLREALRKHPEFADYWSFGFVRNPWARLQSWHAMVMRRAEVAAAGNHAIADRIARNPFWTQVITEHPTFESFVMDGTERIKRLRRPQVDYFRGRDRTADFIGRTETFAEDADAVFRRIGVTSPAVIHQQHNAGPRRDYRDHYTPAMRDRVADLFRDDLDAFGYTFDA